MIANILAMDSSLIIKNPTVQLVTVDSVQFDIPMKELLALEYYRSLFSTQLSSVTVDESNTLKIRTIFNSKYFGYIIDLLTFKTPSVVPWGSLSKSQREKLVLAGEALGLDMDLRQHVQELDFGVPPLPLMRGINILDIKGIQLEDIKHSAERHYVRMVICERCGTMFPASDSKTLVESDCSCMTPCDHDVQFRTEFWIHRRAFFALQQEWFARLYRGCEKPTISGWKCPFAYCPCPCIECDEGCKCKTEE
ncbi:hypothetical protein PCE1_002613 [Barthelona sp. PCE]